MHNTLAIKYGLIRQYLYLTSKSTPPKGVGVEDDASPPGFQICPLPRMAFDLLTPEVNHFMPLPCGSRVPILASNLVHSVSKYRDHKFSNKRTDEWTGWEHYLFYLFILLWYYACFITLRPEKNNFL